MHDCSEIKAKGELKSVRGSLSDSDFKKEKKKNPKKQQSGGSRVLHSQVLHGTGFPSD